MQRGNCEQRVFEEEADYRHYLDLLKECSSRYQVDIWAYCLMPNHVHLICVPKSGEGLARASNTLHMRFAQHFNSRRSLQGHLWRARFMSCVLDEACALEEIRFVENNPVRAGRVALAEEYRWSSARAHVLGGSDPVLCDGFALAREIGDWRTYLRSPGDPARLLLVRSCLKTGRPAGRVEFVRQLESILGRRLKALPRGRPRKTTRIRYQDR